MRTIDREKSPQEYFKYFQELISSKKTVLVWQVDANSKKRSLAKVVMLSCRREDNALKAESIERFKELKLPEKEVYFYIEQNQLMFKAKKVSVEENELTAFLPEEMRLLSDDEHVTVMEAILEMVPPQSEGYLDYTRKKKRTASSAEQSERDKAIFEEELSFVTLDEEDRLFADKRDAPRARPQKGKKVTIKQTKGIRKTVVHPLFDLSRGGLSILTEERKMYSTGDVVEIMSFGNKKLDDPMLAEVKSIREADEQGTTYKIGMQFA